MRFRLTFEATLQRAWMGRGALACLLWPVSLVYSGLVRLRRQLFLWDILKTNHTYLIWDMGYCQKQNQKTLKGLLSL